MGRPDICSPINVTAKETDLSRFHELKSCSYLFPVKKCFQVDQQHIFSHRGDFGRAELLQLRHEGPLRATAYLVSRLCALGRSDERGGKSSHPKARCCCWTWRLRGDPPRSPGGERAAPADVSGTGRGLAGPHKDMMSLPASGPSRISEHIYHLLTTQRVGFIGL